jgi:hypothetical protein
MIKGTRVTVPIFEISSCPSIRISDVRTRRFSIIDGYHKIYDWTFYE